LLACGIGQGFGGFLGGFQLGDGLRHVHLGALRIRASRR
jgi:hypothetical protein